MKPAALRWPVLLSLYLASRLVALTALPMFLDERIYLRWAYWIAQGRRLRLPFIGGKGLSVWVLAAVTPHADDPLLVGRLLTVAIGIVTLLACHRIALRMTGDGRVAAVAALFYIFCPFTLFHDRMVLADAFLSAFTALALSLSVALAEAPRPRIGIALGLALALGVLSKTTGLLVFAVPSLALALASPPRRPALRPLALAYVVAATLTAYPIWLFFSRKSAELSKLAGLGETDPSFTANAAANAGRAAAWLWAYWTPGLVLLALVGLASGLAQRERRRAAVLLAVLAAGPVLAFMTVSKVWFPRYVLFATVPLLVLSTWGFFAAVDLVSRRARLGRAPAAALAVVALVAVLVPALRFDLALWTDPSQAPFPSLDRFQYVTGWPSGYGSRDSMAFLAAQRERHPGGLLVVTPGPSTTASAVRLLWAKDPAVEVRSIAAPEDVPAPRAEAGRAVVVIVSLAEGVRLPQGWTHELTQEFASFKPDGTPADAVYRASQ